MRFQCLRLHVVAFTPDWRACGKRKVFAPLDGLKKSRNVRISEACLFPYSTPSQSPLLVTLHFF